MNNEQRKMIREGHAAGRPDAEIADAARVDEESVHIYLTWWLDRDMPAEYPVDTP